MNVVLPLWAEPSPAVLHMGQFCCAKGAGRRQLRKGGGWGRHCALANSLLGATHSCNGRPGRKERQGWICIHAAPTLTLRPAQWHKGLRAQTLCLSGRKGGPRGKGSHLAPVPGRSLLSTDGLDRGRSRSGSGPQERILDLMQ